MVDEVLAHQDATGAEDELPWRLVGSFEACEGPAVHVESTHLLDQPVVRDQARNVGPGREHVPQPGQPFRRQQEGSGTAPGFGGPPDDLVALRDEDPPLPLQAASKLRIPQRDVVTHPGVVGVGDVEAHARKSSGNFIDRDRIPR